MQVVIYYHLSCELVSHWGNEGVYCCSNAMATPRICSGVADSWFKSDDLAKGVYEQHWTIVAQKWSPGAIHSSRTLLAKPGVPCRPHPQATQLYGSAWLASQNHMASSCASENAFEMFDGVSMARE